MKKRFLLGQAMVNSIGGAFQHAGVYIAALPEGAPQKKEVRDVLSSRLQVLASGYSSPVGDVAHCSAIEALAESMSRAFHGRNVLREDRFRIGVAQKALNLYLKYLWCFDEIPAPPHCPIDRRVIGALGISWKERSQYDWTKLDCIEKYRHVISLCEKKAGSSSIAEWELKTWTFEMKNA